MCRNKWTFLIILFLPVYICMFVYIKCFNEHLTASLFVRLLIIPAQKYNNQKRPQTAEGCDKITMQLTLAYLLVSAEVLCCLFSLARTLAWWASYSSRLGYILDINASKLGSGRSDLLDTSFFRHVGHSLLPLRSAVIIQSWQKRCKHSFVVIVFFSMSKHIGHINSLCKLLGETAISVLSVIASWGVLWSSYKLNSHVLLGAFTTSFAIFIDLQTGSNKGIPKPITISCWRKHSVMYNFIIFCLFNSITHKIQRLK